MALRDDETARNRARRELIARHRSEFDALVDVELVRLRGYGRIPGRGAPRTVGIERGDAASAA